MNPLAWLADAVGPIECDMVVISHDKAKSLLWPSAVEYPYTVTVHTKHFGSHVLPARRIAEIERPGWGKGIEATL